MLRCPRIVAAVALFAAVAGACVGGGAEVSDPVPTLFEDPAPIEGVESGDTDAPSIPSTTTVPVAERLPPLDADVAGAIRADDGTARPIIGSDGEVYSVWGACAAEAVEPAATAVLIGSQHVVLDPGGGGADRGTTRGSLEEAELNLDIAERTATVLRGQGVEVALTRERDTDLSAGARGALGPAVGARALVSIHHPSAGSEVSSSPRPVVFHQVDDPESRRLGALVHESMVAAFTDLDREWQTLEDPGVRPLLNQRGDDFFVVLDRSGGAPAVSVEVAALGENETSLLSTEEGRSIEAEALADAVVRFLVTDDQGSGVVEPAELVRTAPTSNTPGGCGA